MNKKDVVENFFGFTLGTYFNWKKEKRPIIDFIETYFTKSDLEEYLEQGSVSKLKSLTGSTSLTADTLYAINNIVEKMDRFSYSKTQREGILILFYRVVRDMSSKNLNKHVEEVMESQEYLDFIDRYSLLTSESLKNLLTPGIKKQVKLFFSDYLSKEEIKVLLENRQYVLPPLKSMRKHNAHLDD